MGENRLTEEYVYTYHTPCDHVTHLYTVKYLSQTTNEHIHHLKFPCSVCGENTEDILS